MLFFLQSRLIQCLPENKSDIFISNNQSHYLYKCLSMKFWRLKKNSTLHSWTNCHIFFWRFSVHFYLFLKEINIVSSYTNQKSLLIVPSYFHHNFQLFLFMGLPFTVTNKCWNWAQPKLGPILLCVIKQLKEKAWNDQRKISYCESFHYGFL